MRAQNWFMTLTGKLLVYPRHFPRDRRLVSGLLWIFGI